MALRKCLRFKNMAAKKFIRLFFVLLLTIYFISMALITIFRKDTFRLPLHQKLQTLKWCKGLKPKEEQEPVVFVSFPGSGNTWMRYLLQQASGIYTGSIYNDNYLKKMGFPGDGMTGGKALVVKTHLNVSRTKEFVPVFRSAVLLMRNPRDTMLSLFHFLYNYIQIDYKLYSGKYKGEIDYNPYNKEAPPSAFRTGQHLDWVQYVPFQLKLWEDMYTDWLVNFPGPMLIVFYEQLVNDTRNVLQRTMFFLNVTVTEEDLDCALKHKDDLEILKRPKKYQHFDPFTSDMYQKLQFAKLRVFKLLDKCKRCKTSETFSTTRWILFDNLFRHHISSWKE